MSDDDRRDGFTFRKIELWIAITVNLIAILGSLGLVFRWQVHTEDRLSALEESFKSKYVPLIENSQMDVAIMKSQYATILANIQSLVSSQQTVGNKIENLTSRIDRMDGALSRQKR